MPRDGRNDAKMGRMGQRIPHQRTEKSDTKHRTHKRTRMGEIFHADIRKLTGNQETCPANPTDGKQPEIETWLNQDYTEQDIYIELRNLALNKSHGNDGIPGEAYKATREWAIEPTTKIANLIKGGNQSQSDGQKER